MKNKKGFTLVEMLLTLCILTIISLIVVPNVVSTFKKARDNEYQRFLSDIFLSTEAYVQKNIDKYSNLNGEGKKAYVYVEDLLKSKYLKSSLYDPKNKVKIKEENYFTVEVIVKDDGSYTYKLYEELLDPNYCEYGAGKEWTFDYTGSEQEFAVPCNGNYKVETWGAQGDFYGGVGFGAYSVGEIGLLKDNKLYVIIGQRGQYQGIGGYNGGGRGSNNNDNTYGYSVGGGGATHIAYVSGTLSSIGYNSFVTQGNGIIVAGGGGGHSGWQNNGYGGHAGGYTGNVGLYNNYAAGGTQTSGGSGNGASSGTFGAGGYQTNSECSTAGGGGGLFGGGAACNGGGGGGSGYIGNQLLTDKVMYCYNCTASSDESTKTISTTNVSTTPISNYAKQGNGYARITYLGI